MTRLDILIEVTAELDRFKERLQTATAEEKQKRQYSSKKYAAAKRAAFDLKNVLTKLTQDTKYLYGNK